jgi:hypothetical protein
MRSTPMRLRRFLAEVSYTDPTGTTQEQTFPVHVEEFAVAKSLAVTYVLQVLRLKDFELRIVGA